MFPADAITSVGKCVRVSTPSSPMPRFLHERLPPGLKKWALGCAVHRSGLPPFSPFFQRWQGVCSRHFVFLNVLPCYIKCPVIFFWQKHNFISIQIVPRNCGRVENKNNGEFLSRDTGTKENIYLKLGQETARSPRICCSKLYINNFWPAEYLCHSCGADSHIASDF